MISFFVYDQIFFELLGALISLAVYKTKSTGGRIIQVLRNVKQANDEE
jgi:hypothetical protein